MSIKNAIGYDIDDALHLIGLRRSHALFGTILPAIGLVCLGAAIGASAGLMLAPSSGRRLRQDVGDRLDQIKERMKTEAHKRGVVNATPQQQS